VNPYASVARPPVVPDGLQRLRVVLVGYRERDGGPRVERIDIIDTEALRSLVSLSPADALALADQLREAVGWPGPGNEPGS
jgi:hypothetical protein